MNLQFATIAYRAIRDRIRAGSLPCSCSMRRLSRASINIRNPSSKVMAAIGDFTRRIK